jgi:two-component system KDP operon response regulator KdpE
MTEAMFRVLVVEDDPGIRTVLRTLLAAEGHRVITAESAERALIEAKSHKPDLVLLDLGLPDADGQVVIRRIRQFSQVPILVLSARSMEAEKIAALDGGADDYVTKPFSSTELLARVRAALRRKVWLDEPTDKVQVGPLTVDLQRRTAQGPDGPVHLTPLEFRVLEPLVRQRGLVVTREAIIRAVWGPDRTEDTRGLRSYIKMLRQKIEPDPSQPRLLVTEAGIGYRLHADESGPPSPRDR